MARSVVAGVPLPCNYVRLMAARKANKGPAVGNGRLRIIGGQWRGRKLPVPQVEGLRPTSDRVRETLFNWLAADIHDLTCLDLFGGTGALGFEALSRGAAAAMILEVDPRAVAALRAAAAQLGGAVEIRQIDALSALRHMRARFDLVFVDPPFALGLWDQVLHALPAVLNPGHRVYVEAPRSWPGPVDPAWQILKEKAAADVVFRLLHYSGPLSMPAKHGENE